MPWHSMVARISAVAIGKRPNMKALRLRKSPDADVVAAFFACLLDFFLGPADAYKVQAWLVSRRSIAEAQEQPGPPGIEAAWHQASGLG